MPMPMPKTAASPSSRPSSSLHIRPARFEDMQTVAGFIRSSADWYRPFVDAKDMAEHEVDERWAKRNFERRDFYVGYRGQTPIGTISIQYFERYAYLGYIYLDVDHVGHGFGRTLIDFAQQQTRSAGARGMALIAHPEATWATKAYLKYGFERVETERAGVLAWEDGALRPYYEEGFELYVYEFAGRPARAERGAEAGRTRPELSLIR